MNHFFFFVTIFIPCMEAATDEDLANKVNALRHACLRIKHDVDQWLEQGHIDGLYRFDQMVTAELKFINKVKKLYVPFYDSGRTRIGV